MLMLCGKDIYVTEEARPIYLYMFYLFDSRIQFEMEARLYIIVRNYPPFSDDMSKHRREIAE